MATNPVLKGRQLRYAVAVLLHEAQRTMTLDELAATLARRGHSTSGDR